MQGSWHVWRRVAGGSGGGSGGGRDDEWGEWRPVVAASGHGGEVTGLAWGGGGAYLVSCSKDHSTRAFALALLGSAPDEEPAGGGGGWADGARRRTAWVEIGRPQVHGYEVTCVIAPGCAPHRLVSGADEKVSGGGNPFVETVAAPQLTGCVCCGR